MTSGVVACLLALLLVGSARADVAMPVSFSDVASLPARAPDSSWRYGDAASQTAQLWLPGGQGPFPVVVLIHGGCWLVDYGAGHLHALAAQLAEEGFAVWLPEYRRVGEAGGGWPGTVDDVRAALEQLATLDEPRLDRQRLLLVGHSAGGHLALWLAGQPAPDGTTVRAAIGLAPITDLASYARGENSCEQVTARFMGGSPDDRAAAYAAASPAARPLSIPAILFRGAEDAIVPAEQIAAMAEREALRSRTLPVAGHFDWIHPQTEAYRLWVDTARSLLEIP